MYELKASHATLMFMKEAMTDSFNKIMASIDEAVEEYEENSSQVTLSSQQIQAMKDAGVWDDPHKRMDMINRYRNHLMRGLVDENSESEDEYTYDWVSPNTNEAPKPKKKLHWTQTPKGKKILAARKRSKK